MKKENIKPRFVDPTRDIVFKTLWIRGNEYVIKYLERMVEFSIRKPLGKYVIATTEMGKDNYDSIAFAQDVVLLSEGSLEKTNIEMNRIEDDQKQTIKKSMNKSRIYITTMVSRYYDKIKKDNKYEDNIIINQVNFNTFHCPYDEAISRLDYEIVDVKNQITDNYMQTHHLYLPQLKEMCYSNCEDIYKDFALLMSEDYEEMEKLASGNKEREEVVKLLKRLGSDSEYMDYIDREEYNEIISRTAGHEEGLAKGLEQGRTEGIEQGKKTIVQNMYDSGMKLEDISKFSKMPLEEVKKIIES